MSDPMNIGNMVGDLVLAVGALGTASFALVDATKIGRRGGISNSGFGFVEDCVRSLLPEQSAELLYMLHGHWINGSALADQKAIAKSLLKLKLDIDTAAQFAEATNVDTATLTEVAASMRDGSPLTDKQSNTLGRFDLYLTARLDTAYQRADQKYRNSAKFLASVIAVLLALFGGWAVAANYPEGGKNYFGSAQMFIAIFCGLLATPLAPISKDLASALQAGVKVAQAIRK